jgi:hypothetical protein
VPASAGTECKSTNNFFNKQYLNQKNMKILYQAVLQAFDNNKDIFTENRLFTKYKSTNFESTLQRRLSVIFLVFK